jgi:hypothetical protein
MASRGEKAAAALTREAAIKSFIFCLLVSLYEMGIYRLWRLWNPMEEATVKRFK